MASITYDRATDRRTIQVICPDRKRRSIRLGTMAKHTATTFRHHVAMLENAANNNEPIPAKTARWLTEQSPLHHDRIARTGLIEARDDGDAPTLEDLLDRFEEASVVKASTKAAYKQATDSLRGHFELDTPLDSITSEDAEHWHKMLVDSKLARATVAKRVSIAKTIFRRAVRWSMIQSSPFADLKVGSQANPDRSYYVSRASIAAVMAACPDDQWRAIVALSRFAGLRCPSEISLLRWGDLNWERGRLTVRSPKTASHDGHAVRIVPIAPELRPILQSLFDAAEDGEEAVLPSLRDAKVNLRTTFNKIIAHAGETPWPRLFHNLRASCGTDWAERFPGHVVAGWLGHSPLISAKHYLQTRDRHFDLATGAVQDPVQQATASERKETKQEPAPAPCASKQRPALSCGRQMGAGGFEPPKAYASRFTVCPLWPLGYTPSRSGA